MVRADKQLVRVSQNVESFAAFISGLGAMQDQIDSLGGDSEIIAQSLKEALEPAAKHYTKVVEDKIHYEAKMNRGFDSHLRHLYQGGNPDNMGEETKKLFNVNYRPITQGRGTGWETYIRTTVDSVPSVSDITGSDRKLDTDSEGNLVFSGEKYPIWKERAAFVYGGMTAHGRRSKGFYLRYAAPQPDSFAERPPTEAYSASSFVKDYSGYKRFFKTWWENELKVSGFEMVEAFDNSMDNAAARTLNKLWMYAKSQEGPSSGANRAAGRLAGRSHAVFPTNMTRGDIKEMDTKTAKKISKVFYKEFVNAINRNKHKIKTVPNKPAPSVPNVQGEMSKLQAERLWRAEMEAYDEKKIREGNW